jgi:hypothetical protein
MFLPFATCDTIERHFAARRPSAGRCDTIFTI